MAKVKQSRGTGSFRLVWLACAFAGMWMPLARAQTASEIVLHNFGSPPRGANPSTGVIRDPAGNLYGTTWVGGTAGVGLVYRLDPAGHYTVLYSFTGGADGAQPMYGVIRDSNGNLYGTATGGGAFGCGVVFELDRAGQETTLYTFTGGADGCYAVSGVIRDPQGNLYGAAEDLVYKLDTAGHETVLYSFCSLPNCADGAGPFSGLVRDPEGNLYGTAQVGGTGNCPPYFGCGIVFMLSPAGQETILYNFQGGQGGQCPCSGLIRDSAGNLYGTTNFGGAPQPDDQGLVYELVGGGGYRVLYTFGGENNTNSGVIRDSAGNLYGTANDAVYELDTAGQITWLYAFTGGADGGNSEAGVIRDSAGNLYGTTENGGVGGAGVVYQVTPAGQETVLYSFMAAPGGTHPWAGVVRDSSGNLYGTTTGGGPSDMGVVYELDAKGQETVLYNFTGYPGNGGIRNSGVIRDSSGNLYGTTNLGGPSNWGMVYEVDAAGQETMLYGFGADGSAPLAGVIRDADGNLYGTTSFGGTAGHGVVYELDAAGVYTVLYTFTGGAEGGNPTTGVIRDSAGNLYGTAGPVYELDTAGSYTVLDDFPSYTDGMVPASSVIRDSAGNLYGTTEHGGTGGAGVVYKLDPSGNETVLYNFTGFADGGNPTTGVIRDAAGNLYGTTPYGGVAEVNGGFGVVYKLDTSGNQTVLHTFTGGADGGNPQAGLIRDAAGNLFGTTANGGKFGAGIVFKLKAQ